MAVTVLVSIGGFASAPFMERCLFEPEAILRYRQYHRLITSGFLHANWPHLAVNMFSFYSFGGSIESLIGPSTLLVVYFSSILGGNLLSLLLHRNHAYRALGASGGVCGVVFASIFLIPGSSVYLFPVPVPIPASIFAVLFIVISFFGIQSRRGNIGHDAHLGGAVIGLLVTTLLHPVIIAESPILWMTVVALSVALFIYLHVNSRRRSARLHVVQNEDDGRKRWP